MSFISSQYQQVYSSPPSSTNNDFYSTLLSQHNIQLPTFFEIMTQDRMISGLKTALKYILTMASQRNFNYLPILKYYDELFAILQFLIEHHFLSHFDSSFSEHLFGLKRLDLNDLQNLSSTTSNNNGIGSSLQRNNSTLRLSNWKRQLSLFGIVFIPYLRDRCDGFYQDWKRQLFSLQQQLQNNEDVTISSDNSTANNNYTNLSSILNSSILSKKQKLKLLFIKIWPFVSSIYEGLHFFFIFFFLLKRNRFPFHHPFLYFFNLCLKRVTPNEYLNSMKFIQNKRNEWIHFIKGKGGFILGNVASFILQFLYSLSDYSTHLLLAIAFFFKFFEWYFTNQNTLQSGRTDIIPKSPTPPIFRKKLIKKEEKEELIDECIVLNPRVCPLCGRERKNPTVLTVSGFVFCYKCIFEYIGNYHQCPITLIPDVTNKHLRRIFEN